MFPVEHPRHRKRISDADAVLRGAYRKQISTTMESLDLASEETVSSLLAQWIQQDPAGAGRFAKSLPAGRWREMTIRRVAQDWAMQDTAHAERWAAHLSDPDERDLTVADVCFQVAQTDAHQAVVIAQRHGSNTSGAVVLDHLVQQWAEQDAAEAAVWIDEQPAGEQRDQWLGHLAYVQSETDPATAASLVVRQIPTGPSQNEAVVTILHQWARHDMASASGWVDQLLPGALRAQAEAELQALSEYSR